MSRAETKDARVSRQRRAAVAVLVVAGFVLLALGAMTVGEARTLSVRGVEVSVSPVGPADARGWFEMDGQTYLVDQRTGDVVVDPQNPALHAVDAGDVAQSSLPTLAAGLLLLLGGVLVGRTSPAGDAEDRQRTTVDTHRRPRQPQLVN